MSETAAFLRPAPSGVMTRPMISTAGAMSPAIEIEPSLLRTWSELASRNSSGGAIGPESLLPAPPPTWTYFRTPKSGKHRLSANSYIIGVMLHLRRIVIYLKRIPRYVRG
ncbi:MAG: hypothetical protein IPO41_00725 [Acidobacteria bacterium]|nr:hypothetical protein [Acidobacteriota bacterium]